MPRGSRHARNGTQQAGPREDRGYTSSSAAPAPSLPAAKRKVAEALAAMLVAQYRRQQEQPHPAQERRPGA